MCLNLWPIWGHRWVHLKCILEALLEVALPVAPVQDSLLQPHLWATGHMWKSFQKSIWNPSDWTSRSGTLETFWFYLLILCGRASQVALVVKNPPANEGDIRDAGSIPESGRPPGRGHGNPLQYPCLENPTERGAWWVAVHSVTKNAAAKSLQLCLTLCDPIDGSPPGSPGPWDSPGKNTGVGCHFLLQCMKVKSESEVAQLCPTLRDPMDCSPPGSPGHGIFQARRLNQPSTHPLWGKELNKLFYW